MPDYGDKERPVHADEANARGDTILVSDPSPEGEHLIAALLAANYRVIEVSLGAVESRAANEEARVVLIDIEQSGALETIVRLRELGGDNEQALHVICLGDAVRSAEVGAVRGDRRAFDRPVDVSSLLATVREVAQPGRRDASLRGTMPPSSYAPRRETSPPARRESEAPPSEFPASLDPLELGGLLPSIDEERLEPSPDLQHVLDQAEQRVRGQSIPSSAPSGNEGIDLVLAPELLAALDEPLDPEDDPEHGTGSRRGTGSSVALGSSSGGAPSYPGTGTGTGSGVEPRGVGGAAAAIAGPAHGTASALGGAFALGSSTAVGTFSGTSSGFDFGPSRVLGTNPGTPLPPGASLFEEPRYADAEPRLATMQPDVRATDPAAAPSARAQAATTPPPSFPIHDRVDDRSGREPLRDDRSERLDRAPSIAVAPPPRDTRPAPAPEAPRARLRASDVRLPSVLTPGGALTAVALAVGGRLSGSLALGTEPNVRRLLLHEGDLVTAVSSHADETLVAFLIARGDLERELAPRLAGKLPAFGRHAGAALIAHGHLGQDDLWPVLRAHAEWVLGRAITSDQGGCELEQEPPGRLRAEPSVFGGATGAEVLVETVRRVVPPEEALRRLGGEGARLDEGARFSLLAECALQPNEAEVVREARARSVGDVLSGEEPELSNVLLALVALGVLDALAPARPTQQAKAGDPDPLDAEAVRKRVRARLALVEDGDYFALLGVPREATGYEIRRAYLELRRSLEPSRLLTAATADLAEPLQLVVEVLDEAYEILKEPHRRDRYRRAIEAGPPS
jgi:hypothetical protein